jgi:plastocyanin
MKALIVIILVVVIAAAAVFGLTRNNNKTTPPASNPTNSSADQPQASNNQNSSNQPTTTDTVSIQNFAFSPADITVKKGTTVTWTNNDSTTHTVTASSGETGPNSGNLAPGGKYSFMFATAGTFHYHCSIHPEMLGTVTVTQ